MNKRLLFVFCLISSAAIYAIGDDIELTDMNGDSSGDSSNDQDLTNQTLDQTTIDIRNTPINQKPSAPTVPVKPSNSGQTSNQQMQDQQAALIQIANMTTVITAGTSQDAAQTLLTTAPDFADNQKIITTLGDQAQKLSTLLSDATLPRMTEMQAQYEKFSDSLNALKGLRDDMKNALSEASSIDGLVTNQKSANLLTSITSLNSIIKNAENLQHQVLTYSNADSYETVVLKSAQESLAALQKSFKEQNPALRVSLAVADERKNLSETLRKQLSLLLENDDPDFISSNGQAITDMVSSPDFSQLDPTIRNQLNELKNQIVIADIYQTVKQAKVPVTGWRNTVALFFKNLIARIPSLYKSTMQKTAIAEAAQSISKSLSQVNAFLVQQKAAMRDSNEPRAQQQQVELEIRSLMRQKKLVQDLTQERNALKAVPSTHAVQQDLTSLIEDANPTYKGQSEPVIDGYVKECIELYPNIIMDMLKADAQSSKDTPLLQVFRLNSAYVDALTKAIFPQISDGKGQDQVQVLVKPEHSKALLKYLTNLRFLQNLNLKSQNNPSSLVIDQAITALQVQLPKTSFDASPKKGGITRGGSFSQQVGDATQRAQIKNLLYPDSVKK